MAYYLIKFSQTAETWQKMMAKPEDRRPAVRAAAKAAGGKLHGYWYAFGDCDGYALLEFPDNVSAAAEAVVISASGALEQVETTVLITVEDMLKALSKAKKVKYRPPGGKQ